MWRIKNRWKTKEVDWIKFDSSEEKEIYEWIRDWVIAEKTWVEELKDCILLDARPPSIEYIPKFKAWWISVRKRQYTSDFLIKLKGWEEILLEYKSAWTEKDSVYRLKRGVFLFFYKDKIKFAELIKIRKWVYEFRKYY